MGSIFAADPCCIGDGMGSTHPDESAMVGGMSGAVDIDIAWGFGWWQGTQWQSNMATENPPVRWCFFQGKSSK